MLRGTETVIIIRDIEVGEDSYGEMVVEEHADTVTGVLVNPGATDVDNLREEVRSSVIFTLYFPKGIVVSDSDRIQVRSGTYFVAGASRVWEVPRGFRSVGGQVVHVSRERNFG